MQEIQMVDLKGQYLNIKDQIDKEIQDVIENTNFINGPVVKEFENNLADFLNVKHVISCANGTDALQIALMSLDLPIGSEIITTDFTFVATAEVVKLLGCKPVFADVDPDTFNISIESINQLINKNTKAIIPVHLFGQCARMDEIMALAKKHNLIVIEDNAQALGADYFSENKSISKAGTIGHIGTTSFFPSKNLGCYGDGGAVFTNDDNLAHKIRQIANHGQSNQYYYDLVGVNSRLDSLQAAILNAKLPHLKEYNLARKLAADFYDMHLKDIEGIKVPVRSEFSSHIFHQYTLIIENGKRDALQKHLNSRKISSKIYYPVPLHIQKPYLSDKAHCPVTDDLCKKVLSLPMHTELKDEQLQYIVDSIRVFFN